MSGLVPDGPTRLLAVVPVIDPERGNRCLASMIEDGSSFGIPPADVLVIDNTRVGYTDHDGRWGPVPAFPSYRDPDGHNLGVARSWNIGARRVLADPNLDYLLIVSASMLFGPTLHTTWLEQMHRHDAWGSTVIECDGHSWHLIAFHRKVFETVGVFDPAFYPAYEEGIDFAYRMRMAGLEGGWPRVWVNALSTGVAAHVGMVSCPNPPLAAYYAEKWGGIKGQERFVLPWGDRPLDTITEEPIPVLAERYGLARWW